ncbi:MAG: lipoyl(octanoyl) transferase LipB [Candidatus Hinthialibacter antarcticus]|nr:lipoyl(octanoyl) transferase LipB [Candidatus Hinthialibacter antarcticus]
MTTETTVINAVRMTVESSYAEVERFQESKVDCGEETLALCEHPPTITLGTATQDGDLLLPDEAYQKLGIVVHPVRRGGQATFHGPGQLVAYPILNLRERGLTIHTYLRFLEELLVEFCDDYGIEAQTIAGKTGVWVQDRKLAFIGVRVRKGFCFHGCSVNVTPQHEAFQRIVPCGMANLTVTSLQEETANFGINVWSAAGRIETLFHHRLSQLSG